MGLAIVCALFASYCVWLTYRDLRYLREEIERWR